MHESLKTEQTLKSTSYFSNFLFLETMLLSTSLEGVCLQVCLQVCRVGLPSSPSRLPAFPDRQKVYFHTGTNHLGQDSRAEIIFWRILKAMPPHPLLPRSPLLRGAVLPIFLILCVGPVLAGSSWVFLYPGSFFIDYTRCLVRPFNLESCLPSLENKNS